MSEVSLVNGHIENVEHCVCCGEVIPEGRQFCWKCGSESPNYDRIKGMSETEILLTAIERYGAEAQEKVAIEECSELIQAIIHKHRGREDNIAEEIADVEIMLEQLKIINCCTKKVKEIHKQKIERLYNRLKVRLM